MFPMHNRDGNFTYFRSPPIEFNEISTQYTSYKYSVKYASSPLQWVKETVFASQEGRCTQETGYRKLCDGNNHYDVLNDPINDDHYQRNLDGQIFYTKMLYDEIETDGRNLKEMLIESERVGLRYICQKDLFKQKREFVAWISNSTRTELTPPKSAFLCSSLSQFYRSGSYDLLKDIDGKQTVDDMLNMLRDCSKASLTESSLIWIKKIHHLLYSKSSFPTDLGYILNFCHLFDCGTIHKNIDRFKSISGKEFDKIVHEVTRRILQLEENEEKERFIKCTIDRTPDVQSLWRLSHILKNEHFADDAVVNKFKKFNKIDVFDDRVWREAPHSLRERIAGTYANAVFRHVTGNSRKTLDEGSVITLLLDRDLQSGASDVLVDIMKRLSKSENNYDAILKVLNSPDFVIFWKEVKESDKEKIVYNLVLNKVDMERTTRRDNVVKGFQALEELSKITCLSIDEDLLEKRVFKEMQRCGLPSIVAAYKKIHHSVGTVGKESYSKFLLSTVQNEEARPNDRCKLVDCIRTSSDSGIPIDE